MDSVFCTDVVKLEQESAMPISIEKIFHKTVLGKTGNKVAIPHSQGQIFFFKCDTASSVAFK